MTFTFKPFVFLAAGLLAASSAFAQEAAAPAAAPDLAIGQEVQPNDGVGSTYTRESFGDWQMRCIKTADSKDPCQLYQLLKDDQGNSVSEISLLGLPDGGKAVAGATIATPLETLLTKQLTIVVDGGTPKVYPFSWCTKAGCFARIGLTAEDIAGFKKGSKATLTVFHASAADKPIDLTLSLSGFTAGFDAVNASNAANK